LQHNSIENNNNHHNHLNPTNFTIIESDSNNKNIATQQQSEKDFPNANFNNNIISNANYYGFNAANNSNNAIPNSIYTNEVEMNANHSNNFKAFGNKNRKITNSKISNFK